MPLKKFFLTSLLYSPVPMFYSSNMHTYLGASSIDNNGTSKLTCIGLGLCVYDLGAWFNSGLSFKLKSMAHFPCFPQKCLFEHENTKELAQIAYKFYHGGLHGGAVGSIKHIVIHPEMCLKYNKTCLANTTV